MAQVGGCGWGMAQVGGCGWGCGPGRRVEYSVGGEGGMALR